VSREEKNQQLGVLLTNETILVWIDRGFLRRRTIIICVVLVEEIVESMRLFAEKRIR
jgi:hypothetical protein